MNKDNGRNKEPLPHASRADAIREPGSAYRAEQLSEYTTTDEARQPHKGMNRGMPGGYTLTDEVRQPHKGMNRRMPGGYTLEDYLALPDNVRAELIDGELIYMEAPTTKHQEYLFETASALRSYIRKKGGACKVMISPLDVQLDCDNRTVVQPDIIVVCTRDKITEKRICGAPDFCIEISSPSSRSLDRKTKLRKYRDAGVREYWIVDTEHRQILCYFFEADAAPAVYTFDNPVPVRIFQSDMTVSFSDIEAELP